MVSGCSSLSTGLVFKVPKIQLKSNSYLVDRLWSVTLFCSVKCIFFGATLHRSESSKYTSNMQRVHHVVPITCFLSHSSLFLNISSLIQPDDAFKLIYKRSFIGVVYPLYMLTFPLIALLEIYKYISSLENIACPIII